MLPDNDKSGSKPPRFEDEPETPDALPAGAEAPTAPAEPSAALDASILAASRVNRQNTVDAAVVDRRSMLAPEALQKRLNAVGEREGGSLVALDKLTLPELLELRNDIDRLLPPRTLAEMDMEEELLLQLHASKDLMARTLASGGAETNHQAQTVNTCTGIIEKIVKLQGEIHKQENVKAIEIALERTMKDQPQEIRLAFFEKYAEATREQAAMAGVRVRERAMK